MKFVTENSLQKHVIKFLYTLYTSPELSGTVVANLVPTKGGPRTKIYPVVLCMVRAGPNLLWDQIYHDRQDLPEIRTDKQPIYGASMHAACSPI